MDQVTGDGSFEINIENAESTDDAEEGAEFRNSEDSWPSSNITMTNQNAVSNQLDPNENTSNFTMQSVANGGDSNGNPNVTAPIQNQVAEVNTNHLNGTHSLFSNENQKTTGHPPVKKRKGKRRRGRKRKSEDLESAAVPQNEDGIIKVYVFACGHVCSHCNSSSTKSRLEESGINTIDPLTTSPKTKETPLKTLPDRPPYIIRPSPHLLQKDQVEPQPYIIRPSNISPSSHGLKTNNSNISTENRMLDEVTVKHETLECAPSNLVVKDVMSLAQEATLDDTNADCDQEIGNYSNLVVQDVKSLAPDISSGEKCVPVSTMKDKLGAQLRSRGKNSLMKSLLSSPFESPKDSADTGQLPQTLTASKAISTFSWLAKNDSDIQVIESKSNKRASCLSLSLSDSAGTPSCKTTEISTLSTESSTVPSMVPSSTSQTAAKPSRVISLPPGTRIIHHRNLPGGSQPTHAATVLSPNVLPNQTNKTIFTSSTGQKLVPRLSSSGKVVFVPLQSASQSILVTKNTIPGSPTVLRAVASPANQIKASPMTLGTPQIRIQTPVTPVMLTPPTSHHSSPAASSPNPVPVGLLRSSASLPNQASLRQPIPTGLYSAHNKLGVPFLPGNSVLQVKTGSTKGNINSSQDCSTSASPQIISTLSNHASTIINGA